jgi:hypothetical protein
MSVQSPSGAHRSDSLRSALGSLGPRCANPTATPDPTAVPGTLAAVTIHQLSLVVDRQTGSGQPSRPYTVRWRQEQELALHPAAA